MSRVNCRRESPTSKREVSCAHLHAAVPRRFVALLLTFLVVAPALILVPAPQAGAAGAIRVGYSPGSPVASDAISVTVWVDCDAGAPNIVPSFYYYVSGPVSRNNYYSTTHWEGNRATATITFPRATCGPAHTASPGTDGTPAYNAGNCLPSSYDYSWTAALTMIVGQEKTASATTLAVTDDTPHFGDEITFTATVSGGSGTPTGTVEFFDGGSSLGSVALTGGEAALVTSKAGRGSLGSVALSGPSQAALATSKLGIGVHSITASYGGTRPTTPPSPAPRRSP